MINYKKSHLLLAFITLSITVLSIIYQFMRHPSPEEERKHIFQIRVNLNRAIESRNNDLIAKYLGQLNVADFFGSVGGEYILSTAIRLKNVSALNLLLKKGVSCDNTTVNGRSAFKSALSVESAEYLKALLDAGCNYKETAEQKAIGERIINSKFPIKAFYLSNGYISADYSKKAFFLAITKGMYDQVHKMLKLGVNPNTRNKHGVTALYISVSMNRPKVMSLLLKNGANLSFRNSNGNDVLSGAFTRGYLDIAKMILEYDPKYLQREKVTHLILSRMFSFNDNLGAKDIIKSLQLLIDSGVNPREISKHHNWLRKAIRWQNPRFVKELLQLGQNTYTASDIEKEISYTTKSRRISANLKKQITTLLKEYIKGTKLN